MATPVTPAAVVNRPLTNDEEVRLSSDAFAALNMRLAPARLDPKCFSRLVYRASKRSDYKATQEKVRDIVFVNYQDAVKAFANLLYETVKSLAYTSDELVWQVEPKGLQKRRELVREQELGLGKKDNTRFDPAEIERQNAVAVAQTKADKENSAALAELKRSIDSLVFQGRLGAFDYPKMDIAKAELRKIVHDTLKPDGSNAAKVLEDVKHKIAKMHRDNERAVDNWNSR